MKLENKTVEELKNMCRNKKISGYSKLNKQGLVNLLNNNKKVKKGGAGYDISYNNLIVGKYYKCESSHYRNKNAAYYVGKLIRIDEHSAEFHRYEDYINHNNDPNNIYNGESSYTTRGVYYFNVGTFSKKDKLFTELSHKEVRELGFEVWNKKGGSKSNKKGGYVPHNWLTPMRNNYSITNGTTITTKSNLAGNYYNAFVPIQNYDHINLKNFKINNKTKYPIVNKMILDYITSSPNKRKNMEDIKNFLIDYLSEESTKINKNSICTWWFLDSNLNFKQIKGTYIDSAYYQPQMKKDLPFNYDGFIIIKSSDWI